MQLYGKYNCSHRIYIYKTSVARHWRCSLKLCWSPHPHHPAPQSSKTLRRSSHYRSMSWNRTDDGTRTTRSADWPDWTDGCYRPFRRWVFGRKSFLQAPLLPALTRLSGVRWWVMNGEMKQIDRSRFTTHSMIWRCHLSGLDSFVFCLLFLRLVLSVTSSRSQGAKANRLLNPLTPTIARTLYGYSCKVSCVGYSDAPPWSSECPDVKKQNVGLTRSGTGCLQPVAHGEIKLK